jgi:hypothetical protein
MSVANFEQAGLASRPSPSIWKRYRKNLINDLGQGSFFHEDFLGASRVASSASGLPSQVGSMGLLSDDATVTTHLAVRYGVVDLETDGDDNDAWTLLAPPQVEFVLNSGYPVAFEARVAAGAVADQGLFIGLGESAMQTLECVADGGASLIDESYVGFQVLSGDTDGVDAVVNIGGGVGPTKVDALIDTLVADAYVKYGFSFDGKTTCSFYINGVKQSDYTMTSTIWPNAVMMGPVISLKTGTGAAQSLAIDFVRCAMQEQH